MSKKRRRLLMIAAHPEIDEGECTTCLSCGYNEEPEYIDGSYQRSEYAAFCKYCQRYSRHYYCTTTDAGGGISCNIKWCSNCGTPAECTECSSTEVYPAYGPCAYGVHYMSFYMCSSCGAHFGDDGSDHVDCEEEEDTQAVYCPVCHKQATWAGEGYCKQCGRTELYRCDTGISEGCVGYEFCSRGHDTALLDCWLDNGDQCTYNWNPDIFETSDYPCPTCENDSPTVYECPTCGMLRCFNCHTVVRGTIY